MRIMLNKTMTGETFDITNLLTSYTWSGSVERAVREFSFDMINAPYDKELREIVPQITIGDIVSFYTDSDYAVPNYLLFYGKVASTGRRSRKGTITYNCLDFLNNLSKSETNKTYDSTAEGIAVSIASEFGLQLGIVAPTGVSIGKSVFEDKTYLEIINEAYKKAGLSTGKNYYIQMDGDKFCILEEGQVEIPVTLKDTIDVIDSTSDESITDMVNRVNVYDSDGIFKTRIENADLINRFGLFEKNYTIEKDVDMTTGAMKQLHGVDTVIRFTLVGEVNYWSGRSIRVWDEGLGLAGKFLITNDTHTWSGASYITQVNLKFMEL